MRSGVAWSGDPATAPVTASSSDHATTRMRTHHAVLRGWMCPTLHLPNPVRRGPKRAARCLLIDHVLHRPATKSGLVGPFPPDRTRSNEATTRQKLRWAHTQKREFCPEENRLGRQGAGRRSPRNRSALPSGDGRAVGASRRRPGSFNELPRWFNRSSLGDGGAAPSSGGASASRSRGRIRPELASRPCGPPCEST